MKKVIQILMLFAMLIATTGCSDNDVKPAVKKAYPIAKKVYGVGKSLVKSNLDLIDDKTLNTLKKVDKAAKTIDDAKSTIKGK